MTAAAADAGVPNNPDAAWWLKLLARAVGVVGAGGGDFVYLLTAGIKYVCAAEVLVQGYD